MKKHFFLLASACGALAVFLSSCATNPGGNPQGAAQSNGPALPEKTVQYVSPASGALPKGYSKITLRRSADAHPPLYIVDFDTTGYKADAVVDGGSECVTLTEGAGAPKKLNTGVNRTTEMLQQGGLVGALGYGFGRMLAKTDGPQQFPCKVIGIAPSGSVLSWYRPAGTLRLAAYGTGSAHMKIIVTEILPGKEYVIDYTPFKGPGGHQCKTSVVTK